jgi:nucleotide-binding universal stress UspA family protein
MTRIERILCPVDFSEGARHAVDHAIALAHWYDAAVTALHVCPPLVLGPYIDPGVYPLASHALRKTSSACGSSLRCSWSRRVATLR